MWDGGDRRGREVWLVDVVWVVAKLVVEKARDGTRGLDSAGVSEEWVGERQIRVMVGVVGLLAGRRAVRVVESLWPLQYGRYCRDFVPPSQLWCPGCWTAAT